MAPRLLLMPLREMREGEIMFNRTLASWGLVVSMAMTSSCVQQDGLGPIAASNEGPVTNLSLIHI